MCGRLSTTSTRWPSTLASRSARTLPAKPAPTMRVSKPARPGMAPRSAESIDLLCFSKDAPCEQARNLSPALRWQALCRRLKSAVAPGAQDSAGGRPVDSVAAFTGYFRHALKKENTRDKQRPHPGNNARATDQGSNRASPDRLQHVRHFQLRRGDRHPKPGRTEASRTRTRNASIATECLEVLDLKAHLFWNRACACSLLHGVACGNAHAAPAASGPRREPRHLMTPFANVDALDLTRHRRPDALMWLVNRGVGQAPVLFRQHARQPDG